MEENRNEKRTFGDFVQDFWEENKTAIIIGGAYLGGIGLYLLGVMAGAKATNEATNVAEMMMHRDGFLKFFDPETGLEINGTKARELTKIYYKNLK